MWLARNKTESGNNFLYAYEYKPSPTGDGNWVMKDILPDVPNTEENNDKWEEYRNHSSFVPEWFTNGKEIYYENSPIEVFLLTSDEKEEEYNKGVRFATDIATRLMKTTI